MVSFFRGSQDITIHHNQYRIITVIDMWELWISHVDWWVVWLPSILFSQKYWVNVIIPIDELHHFSGRGGPGPPVWISPVEILARPGPGSVGRDWHQRSGEERQIHPARRFAVPKKRRGLPGGCPGNLWKLWFHPILMANSLARNSRVLGAQRLVSAKLAFSAP